jgi:hypothetical protein
MTVVSRFAAVAKNSFDNLINRVDPNFRLKQDMDDSNTIESQLILIKNSDFFHPLENTKTYSSKQDTINTQWKIYRNSYQFLSLALDKATDSNNTSSLRIIKASNFGKQYLVKDIAKKITVSPETYLAEISCVDEATQYGEFVRETDLKGRDLGMVSDPDIERYILDIPGSAALKYICQKAKKPGITLEEMTHIEENRLKDLGYRIASWCQQKDIVKMTVTYHEGCGAVGVRRKNMECFNNTENELEVAHKCAKSLAKAISKASKELDFEMMTTIAFIGNKEMCKLRPMQMHNALGTIGCLDSSVVCKEFDMVTKMNFFDCLVPVEFDKGLPENEFSIDLIQSGINDLLLTVQIAFGSHGWGGEFFSKDRPYFIILFCKNQEQQDQAVEIIHKIENQIEEASFEKLSFAVIRNDL